MRISYVLDSDKESFDIANFELSTNLNFLLTNARGDYLNLGVQKNSTKYQGFNLKNQKSLEVFKVLDEIIPVGLTCEEVEYQGFKVVRKFQSSLVMSQESLDPQSVTDSFYVGPSGGFIYEISNFNGEVEFDLDCRKRDDFEEWERYYEVYKVNDILMVKYDKKKNDRSKYKLFFGIKAPNFAHELLQEWQKKEYEYSKERQSLHELHIFKLIRAHIEGSKRFVIGAGFSEKEVLEQIELLDLHQKELETYDYNHMLSKIKAEGFEKPLTRDVLLAYKLSKNALYNFLNKSLDADNNMKQGSDAGYPWFSDIWARDELASINALLKNNELTLVKERLMYYLNQIDEKSGTIKRIDKQGSHSSPDAVFWLAKRFEDLIFYADERNELFKTLTAKELEDIYNKLSVSFNRIIKGHWDRESELIKVKYADSWMDTIELDRPLDIQVQFLGFISCMGVLAGIQGKKDDVEKFLDLEDGMRKNVRTTFIRDGFNMYNEPTTNKVTCNNFLVHYFYKELLLKDDWEKVMDNTLRELKTFWGGMRSLTAKDPNYKDHYTGENNESYHQGDSWYWINNMAAMALFDINEVKYRKEIGELLLSSTQDILTLGTVGFGSEISSAAEQKPQGCTAQLWTCALYVEMVEKLFSKK